MQFGGPGQRGPGMPGPGMPMPGMFPPPGGMGGMPPMGMFPMMPPPSPYGPLPGRRSGGTGKTVLLILVVLLLAVSVLLNVLLGGIAGSSVAGASGNVLLEQVEEGDPDEKIAVVPMVGLIDDNQLRLFSHYLEQAERDDNIKAVIVEIDSPGGSVTASDEIYARLLRFKQERKIPVIVSMGSMATSGGYYAACAADHIYAQETTLTGNIGVLMPSFNFSKLMEKYGVEENTVVATGAPFKNTGSSFSPETPQGRKHLQQVADVMFARFKHVVWTSRQSALSSNGTTAIEQVADGRLFTAAEAKTVGLVDNVGYLKDAIAYVTTTYGLSRPQVFRYHIPRPGLLDVLLGVNSPVAPGQARGAGGVTINGVNVNVDAKLLDEMVTPRVMYLWRGQ